MMRLVQWTSFVAPCLAAASCYNALSVSNNLETDSETDVRTEDADTGTAWDWGSDSGSDPSDVSSETGPRTGQVKALVIIVDNSQSMEGSAMDDLYTTFPNEIGGALAELYDQPLSEIQSRNMTEIAEDFGEDWIISDVEDKADGHYADTTSLTDDQATFENFISTIEGYSDNGYLVDLLVDLHGTSDGSILFFDDAHAVTHITEQIQSRGLNVGVLYQTVCYGSDMTDEWVAIDIHAVNGSIGVNMYVNFAPGAFLENWIWGANYDDAVQQARIEDMTEMRTRLTAAASSTNNLMMLAWLQTYDFEGQSLQTVAGEFPEIGW